MRGLHTYFPALLVHNRAGSMREIGLLSPH